MISPRLLAASALLAASRFACAAVALDPQLPPYEPGTAVSGEITVAGNHATDDVMVAWAKRFARFHPGVRLRLRDDTRLTTDAFDAAIAAGDIDLVPSARELVPSERERLTRRLGLTRSTTSMPRRRVFHALGVPPSVGRMLLATVGSSTKAVTH